MVENVKFYFFFKMDLLSTFELIAQSRHTTRSFDPSLPVHDALLHRTLLAAQRAPSGFNLQPWVAVVVKDQDQKERLHAACLHQPQIRDAPLSIVFAGSTRPSDLTGRVLADGLRTGYYTKQYEASYVRNAHFMLHGGPLGAMQVVKSGLTACYSALTGSPMISVPTSLKAYAWKQTMLPVGHFLLAATAAGLHTATLEGFDEECVKKIVGLTDDFTVPCVVAIGYAKKGSSEEKRVPSPRLPHAEVFFEGCYKGSPAIPKD